MKPVAKLNMTATTETGGELHCKSSVTSEQWSDLVRIAEGKPTTKEAALQAEVNRLKAWEFLRHSDGSIGVIQSMSADEDSYFQAKPRGPGTSVANDVLFRLASALAPAEGA